jgi:Tol biopolymer transport system component/plastocyanin
VGTGPAGEARIALIACAIAAGLLLALTLVPGSPLRGDAKPAATATAPVKKASFDSEAPVTAPAHWLPPEDWVYNHWLPYDEGRLYDLLGVTRGRIWRQLRDDRHNLAQLAKQRGWPDPAKLAAALVAPRAGEVPPATLDTLRSRAERTITQGHLSQHLLFHSLHQFAIPSEAPEIFGVTDIAFRQLRRAEQSPLEIGRLHGRSPSRIQALSTRVLRERARFGTDTGAMSERQAAILLRRQISQLPRWLAQVRYNGPPPTHDGRLTGTPRDFAANPALSAGGGRVVFESYLQKLPLALKRGEISVLSRAVSGGGAPRNASFNPRRRAPRSAYNPTVSADGRVVAFESAEGNLNFAKRYGQIRVFVNDATTGRTTAMPLPPLPAGVSRSEYNPAISADGRFVAYQAQRRGGQSAVYVTDLRTGRRELASRGPRSAPRADDGVYDPAISGDGRRVAFTTAASNLGAGDLHGRTQVFVRDLDAKTTTLVSRRSGARGAIADDYSADPAISRDGRFVAFSSAAGNLAGGRAGSRIFVRDLRTGRTTAVSNPGRFALKPSISADGRMVAYTAIRAGLSRVYVRDASGRGPERLVSRPSGRRGAADGPSSDAAISGDGRRVAFTSAGANLSPDKPDNRRGVFVRDLRANTTTLLSPAVPPAAVVQAVKPTVGPRAAPTQSAAAIAQRAVRSSTVSIFDNAFHLGRDRPAVHLQAGGTLTWRWASQQSHQVTLRSGPQLAPSPTKTAGEYTAKLDTPGNYTFVCSIHAPGMTMKAIVK